MTTTTAAAAANNNNNHHHHEISEVNVHSATEPIVFSDKQKRRFDLHPF